MRGVNRYLRTAQRIGRQAIVALLYVCGLLLCQGSTYIVPDDEMTIQAAIDSSMSGDTILVRAGTYTENLQTNGKALTLKALGSSETTIIDGNQQGSVVWATADVHIEGFTIRNGLNQNGGGIFIDGKDGIITASIVNNVITQNRAGLVFDSGIGAGIVLVWTVDCLISLGVALVCPHQ